MKNSINLVSQRRKPNAFHKRFFLISTVFFGIVFVVSAGMVGYKLLLTSELSTLEEEEESIIRQINFNEDKKVKFLVLRERLDEAQSIIRDRIDIHEKLTAFSEAIPSDVGIRAIEGEENELVVRVAADTLASLNVLIEQEIQTYAGERGRGIDRVEMRTFALNTNTLQYEATFTIEFE